jgi:hypothetical protein
MRAMAYAANMSTRDGLRTPPQPYALGAASQIFRLAWKVFLRECL